MTENRSPSNSQTVLAADIGGTKILVALVRDGKVLDFRKIPTTRKSSPEAWMSAVLDIASVWESSYQAVGITVTGRVQDGIWQSVNAQTLDVGNYDLASAVSKTGLSYEILNDAQAAAWGEHIHGAARGGDLVYLTVSTGLGGGIVSNGKLLTGARGLAGHFGLISQSMLDGPLMGAPIENVATGPWIARQGSAVSGSKQTTESVFAHACNGEEWAQQIIETSAERVACLCRTISFAIDPPRIVIGGGVGLADGYVERVRSHFEKMIPDPGPEILTSALKENAGIVGVAAYVAQSH